MKVINKKNALTAGFSLVEMLVVIAVIGIIAAIAIPNIGKINDSAKDARKRRNAQNLASVFASAQAAGHDFTGADEAATITAIIAGTTIADTSSPFNGAYFGVKGVDGVMAIDETNGAAKYLELDDDSSMLLYTGGQPEAEADAAE